MNPHIRTEDPNVGGHKYCEDGRATRQSLEIEEEISLRDKLCNGEDSSVDRKEQ